LKNLKTHIKELVERHIGSKDATLEGGTNPLLQEAAREFFERRERAWRPGTVLLMSRALGVDGGVATGGGSKKKAPEPSAKQLQLAEIVEMMVTAQVIHDDVLEDLDFEEGRAGGEGDASQAAADADGAASLQSRGNVAHRMYSSALGNKVSLLAGDFLLARASVQLAQLTNSEVVGIIGTSLENMCRGEIMHSCATTHDKLSHDYYHKKVSLKTASLLADACRCSAVLRGEPSNSPRAETAWRFGHHLAVAYSLSAELDSFNRLLEPHWKQDSEDIKEKRQTKEALLACVGLPPFLNAAQHCPRLAALAFGEFGESEGDVQEALSLLRSGEGTRLTKAAAMEHSALAKAAVLAPVETGGLPESIYRDGLLVLCDYVVQDEQRGLQRVKWQEMEAKKMKLKNKGKE